MSLIVQYYYKFSYNDYAYRSTLAFFTSHRAVFLQFLPFPFFLASFVGVLADPVTILLLFVFEFEVWIVLAGRFFIFLFGLLFFFRLFFLIVVVIVVVAAAALVVVPLQPGVDDGGPITASIVIDDPEESSTIARIMFSEIAHNSCGLITT